MVNPAGQSQTHVANNDKDWNDVLQNLFAIAIGLTINFVHEHVDISEEEFEKFNPDLLNRIYQALQFAEGEDDKPAGFIDSVFGYESNLTKE